MLSEAEWRPIDTAPRDGSTIIVRLSNGRECEAEFWDGPEDRPEWGGWAINFLPSLIEDTHIEDGDAEMVSWKPAA